MSRCRVQVVYSGHVQGVGFRYTVKSITRGFELTGLVRNLLDGRVELVAEGMRQELEEFLKAIRESGLGSLIRQEEISWLQAKSDMRGFEIAG
jgi:acylphosphatase